MVCARTRPDTVRIGMAVPELRALHSVSKIERYLWWLAVVGVVGLCAPRRSNEMMVLEEVGGDAWRCGCCCCCCCSVDESKRMSELILCVMEMVMHKGYVDWRMMLVIQNIYFKLDVFDS